MLEVLPVVCNGVVHVDRVPDEVGQEAHRRWGADAIRDCDGTDYPEELKEVDAKVYSTYYTTRKDNAWCPVCFQP